MKQKILHVLKQADDFVSGEELSSTLGISRTAVWKHIKSLRNEGYKIESVTRKGHRLLDSPEAVYGEEITFGLQTKLLGKKIIFKHTVDSTNNLAKKYAEEGCDEGLTVIAEEQTGGKGRLGRVWQSPPKYGIWMSIVLRPKCEPTNAPQIALLAAAAVARAINLSTGVRAEIKWPNDILVSGKKVCGILTEIKAELEYIHYCVIGIGINVNTPPEVFPSDLLHKATSLKAITGHDLHRASIVREVLKETERLYLLWQEKGFQPVLRIWEDLSCTLGREVTVSTPVGERVTGTAVKIDEYGALLVENEGGIKKITAGDVFLIQN